MLIREQMFLADISQMITGTNALDFVRFDCTRNVRGTSTDSETPGLLFTRLSEITDLS